jgi:hypothetical protein
MRMPTIKAAMTGNGGYQTQGSRARAAATAPPRLRTESRLLMFHSRVSRSRPPRASRTKSIGGTAGFWVTRRSPRGTRPRSGSKRAPAPACARSRSTPNLTPEQSHEGWLEQKRADGWCYGPTNDADLKQHPCYVPYAELPRT